MVNFLDYRDSCWGGCKWLESACSNQSTQQHTVEIGKTLHFSHDGVDMKLPTRRSYLCRWLTKDALVRTTSVSVGLNDYLVMHGEVR